MVVVGEAGRLGARSVRYDQSEVVRFAGDEAIPPWLSLVYLGSHMLLALPNFHWFWMVIAAIKKRFPSRTKIDSKVAKESSRVSSFR